MYLRSNLNHHIMIVYSRLKSYYVYRVARNEKDRKISEFPLNAHHRLLASSPSPFKNRFTREKSNWRADSQAAGGRRRFVKAIKGSRREKKRAEKSETQSERTRDVGGKSIPFREHTSSPAGGTCASHAHHSNQKPASVSRG